MRHLQLQPAKSVATMRAAPPLMAEVTIARGELDDEVLRVVHSLTEAVAAPDAASAAVALAAVDVMCQPGVDHIAGRWVASISAGAENFEDVCNLLGVPATPDVLAQTRRRAAALKDMLVSTANAAARHAILSISACVLRAACAASNSLGCLVTWEIQAMASVQTDPLLLQQRLDWLALLQSTQIVTALQAYGEAGREAVSQQLGPRWLLRLFLLLTGQAITGAVLPVLRSIMHVIVAEALHSSSSRQALLQVRC